MKDESKPIRRPVNERRLKERNKIILFGFGTKYKDFKQEYKITDHIRYIEHRHQKDLRSAYYRGLRQGAGIL